MPQKDATKFARELRRNQTGPEERLWAELRNRRLGGFKFRRQAPLAGYTVDFLCASAKLIVEVDGTSHLGREEYDQQRTREIEKLGFNVVRLGNEDIMDGLHASLDQIHHELMLATGKAP
ncbi:MAG: DUF559 domain-containing protein [Litorimonas sp.]